MELKQNFMVLAQDLFKHIDKQREEAANEALKPDESLKVVKELGTHSEDLSYEECIEYYDLLCHYMYGREYREADFDVVLLDNGKYCAKLPVASAFYPMIIGKKGATKKRLETETKTRVNIPRQVRFETFQNNSSARKHL